MNSSYTDILFANPSIISGIARNVDIMGIYDNYNSTFTETMADNLAIASDWKTIMMDLAISMDKYKTNVAQD